MTSNWRRRLESLPWTEPVDPGGRVVVLSAHPDDEVLAIGGWLAGQTRRDIAFLTATDGECSHAGSCAVTSDELRKRRPRELVHALSILGFEDPTVQRLALPDGELAANTDALRSALVEVVDGADLVLAPFENDGLSDHDVLGKVALDVCGQHTPLWRFPIWTWVSTEPGQQDWLDKVHRLTCTPQGRALKRRALAAFEARIEPISVVPADTPVIEPELLQHAHYAPEVVVG